ncbi:MAG: hypothetical protein K0R64_2416 [Novosphingobium lindaniclasticum]|jgi:hypothetical protein|uniref:hypothetical protein n=1 Tax=Novosphingobium lindaniclasticum TaxID=1329895 RepID=UPI002409D6ED|nr:hypothetical protein [Novosphingobium lindaniclasticum]MDF2639432.1 hypothetical protein [Novosphingobium lindaniclasticum]
MKVYTLQFSEDEHGLAKRLEFKAPDVAGALIIAHREAAKRSADLWEGALKLCTIRRSRDERTIRLAS